MSPFPSYIVAASRSGTRDSSKYKKEVPPTIVFGYPYLDIVFIQGHEYSKHLREGIQSITIAVSGYC